jgi:lysophospholipase L1-like esterase
MPLTRFLLVFFLFAGQLQAQDKTQKPRNHEQWAKQIAAFEEKDQKNPPPRNGIVFAGSSTMVFWKTDKAFPDLSVINRGFGGSYLSDSVYFAPRIITKYEPKTVLVYAGDNDLAGGVTPTQLTKDFQAFVKIIHDKLPQTRILFISVKPSTKRWELFEKQKEANRMIEDICKKDDRLQYVDIVKPLLDASGKPRKELLREEGLHLNDKGYEVLNGIVKPFIEKQKN